MSKKEILNLLDKFRNKAWCYYTEEIAESHLRKLKKVITKEQYSRLSLAFSHFKIWEWALELYSICKELRKEIGCTWRL